MDGEVPTSNQIPMVVLLKTMIVYVTTCQTERGADKT